MMGIGLLGFGFNLSSMDLKGKIDMCEKKINFVEATLDKNMWAWSDAAKTKGDFKSQAVRDYLSGAVKDETTIEADINKFIGDLAVFTADAPVLINQADALCKAVHEGKDISAVVKAIKATLIKIGRAGDHLKP